MSSSSTPSTSSTGAAANAICTAPCYIGDGSQTVCDPSACPPCRGWSTLKSGYASCFTEISGSKGSSRCTFSSWVYCGSSAGNSATEAPATTSAASAAPTVTDGTPTEKALNNNVSDSLPGGGGFSGTTSTPTSSNSSFASQFGAFLTSPVGIIATVAVVLLVIGIVSIILVFRWKPRRRGTSRRPSAASSSNSRNNNTGEEEEEEEAVLDAPKGYTYDDPGMMDGQLPTTMAKHYVSYSKPSPSSSASQAKWTHHSPDPVADRFQHSVDPPATALSALVGGTLKPLQMASSDAPAAAALHRDGGNAALLQTVDVEYGAGGQVRIAQGTRSYQRIDSPDFEEDEDGAVDIDRIRRKTVLYSL